MPVLMIYKLTTKKTLNPKTGRMMPPNWHANVAIIRLPPKTRMEHLNELIPSNEVLKQEVMTALAKERKLKAGEYIVQYLGGRPKGGAKFKLPRVTINLTDEDVKMFRLRHPETILDGYYS